MTSMATTPTKSPSARDLMKEHGQHGSSSNGGTPLWIGAKTVASAAGAKARLAAQKTKLRADIALIDREITNRKRAFGVEMYDQVSPLMESVDFFAMDESDTFTRTIRPPLIATNREIAALEKKREKLKGDISVAEADRTIALGQPAETIGDKMKKAGKTMSKAGSEGKLKTEHALLQRKITSIKQEFGLELYVIFADLEDRENWLPSDRDVRSIYDRARRDIEEIELKKKQKQQELYEKGTYNLDGRT